jgi:hypothetical protein
MEGPIRHEFGRDLHLVVFELPGSDYGDRSTERRGGTEDKEDEESQNGTDHG